jgi:hypothetical protein
LVRNIVGDVNTILSLKRDSVNVCCGMQLRLTPSERDYKEKIREK